ncbi:MAG: YeeE/YedE family protein [Myxococcales bacterium]|nr:YeeE/YedE family protein [Myxococcales bacterium]
MSALVAILSGLLFGVGLGLAGMLQPVKVAGFLDFFAGNWDPTLALVMGGAVVVYAIAHRLITRRAAPLFDGRFHLPTRSDIDPRLLGGAALFGLGWGIGGYCPGPGLTSIATYTAPTLVFVGTMLVGMLVFREVDKRL